MKLNVSIPHSVFDGLRRIVHPSRRGSFYACVAATFLAYLWDARSPHWGLKAVECALLTMTIALAWLGIERRSTRKWMPYLWAGAFVTATSQQWWSFQLVDATNLFIILVLIASMLYGVGDALALAGVVLILHLGAHSFGPVLPTGFFVELFFKGLLLAAIAIIAGYMTSGQRRKILALREELSMVRTVPYAYAGGIELSGGPVSEKESLDPRPGIEALEKGIRSILERIREYFRAHSVLLYQPASDRSLTLRHAVSESTSLNLGHTIELDKSLIGKIFARGVSCNWNLLEPGSTITDRDIPYYAEWQPIRHLAASPLRAMDRPAGILVVDRIIACPFSETEITHLETFAIQLIELIQMGRRYIEQVDQNSEYRLFYTAMSELGQSLATGEILDSLARVCNRIAEASHVFIALQDPSGLSYKIAYALGAEKLLGLTIRNHGRTWISWMLNSGSEPLILQDIGSHFSKMPIASPSEGRLAVRSVLFLPLVAKGRKLGMLFLGSARADLYKNWHMRILTSICQLASADIENSLLHKRVEDEAISDGLTKLHNHRYFQERLKSECSRARRLGSPLSLLMIDIDFFKKVNDTYGHRVGDSILRQIADILKSSLRAEDSIARYGGEEFAVILTGSDPKGASRMAERLRLSIERTTFRVEDKRLQVTITIGSATFPQDASDAWGLIEHADRALYAGKGAGRNGVVQYHSIAGHISKLRNMK